MCAHERHGWDLCRPPPSLSTQYSHALREYIAFVSGTPRDQLTTTRRGRAYKALHQFADALSYLRNAVAQSPTVNGLCLLAETQVAIGDTPGAVRTCNKCRDLLEGQTINNIGTRKSGASLSLPNRKRLLASRLA